MAKGSLTEILDAPTQILTKALHGVDPIVIAWAMPFVGVMVFLCFRRDSVQIRRRWNRAIRYCEFKHPVPISKIRRAEDGYHARIQVGKGISLRDLQKEKHRLEAEMGIGELWFDRENPANAKFGTATITIVVQSDYLADAARARWPIPKPPRP